LIAAAEPGEALTAEVSDPAATESMHRSLARRLGELLGEPVQVVLTDNRQTMVSLKREAHGAVLRLHHMFLRADDRTLKALARYMMRRDRRAGDRLDTFIEGNLHRIRKRRPRSRRLRTAGEHHDLEEIFGELNQAWFNGDLEVQLTWGRRTPPQRRKRSISLGTYVTDDRLIRIHPALDQAWVPRFFVAYVLFHEMLHHVVPALDRGTHRAYHHPKFRRLEKLFPDYERALKWEKANLARLLRS